MKRDGLVGQHIERITFAGEPVNTRMIEKGVEMILKGIGADDNSPALRDTPRRVALSYKELCNHEPQELTSFPNDEKLDQIITVKDIWFYSLCEHHMLPFFGTCSIGYLPEARYFGLSKLARIVKVAATGLQIQERITEKVAEIIEGCVEPKGIAVVIKCRHLCLESRGVQRPGVETITTAMRGIMMDNPAARQEFLMTLQM